MPTLRVVVDTLARPMLCTGFHLGHGDPIMPTPDMACHVRLELQPANVLLLEESFATRGVVLPDPDGPPSAIYRWHASAWDAIHIGAGSRLDLVVLLPQPCPGLEGALRRPEIT